jgi:hypothetical protein
MLKAKMLKAKIERENVMTSKECPFSTSDVHVLLILARDDEMMSGRRCLK